MRWKHANVQVWDEGWDGDEALDWKSYKKCSLEKYKRLIFWNLYKYKNRY